MAYVGCDGIVIEDGCVLLQQREDFRTWGVPGGGLEPGEYLLAGAEREVREETGLEVEARELLAIHWRRWIGRDILVFSFRCRPTGGELRTSAETVDVRYFPTGALPDRILGFQRERLLQVLNGDGRFSYHVQSAPRRAQWTHALRLLGRTVRNRVQRRPAWHPQQLTVGAFATIWNQEGQVLLLHRRDRDAWNLPGGRVEEGESPWDGCLREVQEECGLSARVEALTGVYAKPHKDELVLNFNCVVADGRPSPSDEADRVAYLRPHELPETLLPRQRERILDAAAGAGERTWPLVKLQGADWAPAMDSGDPRYRVF
jgi:ADP-ribose pyrophosphatase YjhB (NUDIX family)